MDLVLRNDDRSGVAVVHVSGELDLATIPRFRDHLARLAASRRGQRVLVDLDGLVALDGAGAGALVTGLAVVAAAGGDVELVCTSPEILDTLRLCRLDRVFTIHSAAAPT